MTLKFNPLGPPFDFVATGSSGSGILTINSNAPDGAGNYVLATSNGVTWVQTANTSTLQLQGAGWKWNSVAGTSVNPPTAGNAYILNNAGTTTVTLPTAPAVGDSVKVIGTGAGGWIIAKGNATDTIFIGNTATLAGGGHYIEASQTGSAITLVCVQSTVGSVIWAADAAPQGNITFV